MRNFSFQMSGEQFTGKMPDEVCFAFNPNYFEMEGDWDRELLLSVGVFVPAVFSGHDEVIRKRSILVTPFRKKLKVYLSRLFELMFEEPEHTRSLYLKVTLAQYDTPGTPVFEFNTLCVWGSLALGERFNSYGVYNADADKKYFERNVVWFKNFPFSLSLFRTEENTAFKGRYDNTRYAPSDLQVEYSQYELSELSQTDYHTKNIGDLRTDEITPAKLIYFARLGKLYALVPGGGYSTNWEADYPFLQTDDCTEVNVPRSDVGFVMVNEGGLPEFYRWDGRQLVDCGNYSTRGYINVFPSVLFPNARHTATIKYRSEEGETSYSVFDDTFDYTFSKLGDAMCLVNLLIDESTAGYYLRWVDRQGCLQYFLFSKGKDSYKTKLGNDVALPDDVVGDMAFPNLMRTANVECSSSYKCCAVHLRSDIFSYVQTVATSPIVDMYLGSDKYGQDIWAPVTIEASTVTFDNATQLHDLEIAITAPAVNSQTL